MADLRTIKQVHFVGIGGIGMSALAQLFEKAGKIVSGSDREASPLTKLLSEKHILIFISHDAAHVPAGTELIVYTDAVPADNVERVRGRERGIPEISYAQALGAATRDYTLIAVSGSHGKTTTTAMIVDVLEAGGLDPTAVIGSLRAKTQSNFRRGESTYAVAEADEYKRHFLFLNPHILVITNVDTDHLDYFKDLAGIQSAFRELAQKVPRDGCIICDPKEAAVKPIVVDIPVRIVDYTDFIDPKLALRVPGEHNIRNAAAALAVADILKISSDTACTALKDFSGTWRRFEYKGTTKGGALVYDDYAHHPTEIRATLKAAREQFPSKKIVVAFQPHLYSRIRLLLNDFARAFGDADEVVIAPIYAAREIDDGSISSEVLAERIDKQGKRARALPFREIEEYARTLHNTNVFMTMGAGDIYLVAESLTKQ